MNHGAKARGELILSVLEHAPDEPCECLQWEDSWRKAAASQLKWAVTKSKSYPNCNRHKTDPGMRLFCDCSSRYQPCFPHSSLDIQVAALVAVVHMLDNKAEWSAAESGFRTLIEQCRLDFVQAAAANAKAERKSMCRNADTGHAAATARMLEWLGGGRSNLQAPSNGPSGTDASDNVDLLEIFARSEKDMEALCESVAILVGHGAMAPGSAILAAWWKAGAPSPDLSWWSLWRRAAKILSRATR